MALRRVPKSMISGLVIETADIANNAVTPDKIPDGSITNAKLNVPSGTLPVIYRKDDPADTDLFWDPTELVNFAMEIEIPAAGVVKVSALVDVKHRGLATNYLGVLGFSMRAIYKTAPTQAGLAAASYNQVKHAVNGGNILSLTDHYGTAVIPAAPFAVSPGWYRFSLEGTAHTDADNRDGLAELNMASPPSDYNFYMLEYLQGASIITP